MINIRLAILFIMLYNSSQERVKGMATIGEIIKKYRQEHGISMEEFGKRSGLSKAYISLLERGKSTRSNKPIVPSIDTLSAIAKAIGEDLDTLVYMLDPDQEVRLGAPEEEGLMKLFSSRLSNLMSERNINQREIAQVVGVSESTVGKWLLLKAMPRMGVIQKLADYFNVGKSYFLEDESEQGYYTDPEVAEYAEELRTNPKYRLLFDASKDLSKEDIDFVVNMIEQLKAREGKE